MCGIAGFVQRSPPGRLLGPMLDRITRRGPDGEGAWEGVSPGPSGDWRIALGHRRLAILDISGGAQPMSSEGGSATLTYNGELYNFRELREGLEKRGIAFRTRSDTEVLLHQVAAHWTAGLSALNGMFAFALWDSIRRTLVLARDRAGIKPLYYATLPGGGLAFASELTALLQHPEIPRTLSARGLQSYFFSDYFHPPTTLIDGVLKLPPGHFALWTDGRLSAATPYARPTLGLAAPTVLKPEALARDLWARLDRAVERQLVADVPVGAFVSGGLDSSCIATLAHKRVSGRLKTFSIAFEDPTFDESAHARALARHIGSEHTEERLGEENLLGVVDLALSRLDEPLADPSYLPTFLLSRLASQHVKVVLSGDGGDELFGGYPTYRAHAVARLARFVPTRPEAIRAWVRGRVTGLRERDRYQSVEWKLKRFLLRWDDDPQRRHLRWMSNLDLDDLRLALPRTADFLPAVFDSVIHETGDPMNDLLALDFCTYMPGSVLTKVDRASMAHGLEVRPPLLDNELVDWARSLPSSRRLTFNHPKALLKRAATGHVSGDIIHRPKKGFGIPLSAWLRGPLRERVTRALGPSTLWGSGLLNREAFERWALMHAARRGDYSKALWALIVLDEWVRREIDAPLRKAERPSVAS